MQNLSYNEILNDIFFFVILVHNFFHVHNNQKHKPLGWAIISPLQQPVTHMRSQLSCSKGTSVFAYMLGYVYSVCYTNFIIRTARVSLNVHSPIFIIANNNNLFNSN